MQEQSYENKRSYIEDYKTFNGWMIKRGQASETIRKSVAKKLTFICVEGIISERNDEMMKQMLSSIYTLKMAVTAVFKIDNYKLSIYLGGESENIGTIQGIAGSVLGCKCNGNNYSEEEIFERSGFYYESSIIGDSAYKKERKQNVLDVILSEGFSEKCSIVISASPISREICTYLADYFESIATELTAITTRQITSRDDKDTVSYTEENGFLKRFQEIVNGFKKKYEAGISEGLFLSSIKIFSDSADVNNLIAGAYVSQSDNTEYPESLQQRYLRECNYNAEIYANMRTLTINGQSINMPEIGNFHTTTELSFFMDFPRNDSCGFFKRIIPDFDMDRNEKEGLLIGEILKSGQKVAPYYISLSEMNRNVLVSGLVGSGKTNTIEHLLMNLHEEGIPFLVIEPVKTEYWELKNVIPNLNVISVGGAKNGLEMNPFQPVSDAVTLQKHVDALYSSIMAAFEWVSPMPQIVEKVIYRVYSDNGFDVANNIRNPKGNYPTVEQVYWTIRKVVKEENFDVRMESDLIGCIGARFNSLRVGNKGRTLNVRKSMEISKLFESSCVIELEEIQDEGVRSFIMGLILANLREYCMLRETSHLKVQHCTVIEEAHTLLKKIDVSSSTAQAKGVKVFSELIKTLRAKGEGFIIVDQVPTELADDVLKNTNLKITHRIVASDDKSALGKTMNCTDEQESYMTVLRRGEAVVFSEGDYRPKLVKVPYTEFDRRLLRTEIIVVSNKKTKQLYDINPACLYCEEFICGESYEVYDIILQEELNSWKEQAQEVKNKEQFEDLGMEIVLSLKRDGKMQYLNCVIAQLVDVVAKTIQEKHELYNLYRSLIEEISAETS